MSKWVVVIQPGSYFGRVGLLGGADHRGGTAKVEVQFGTSGPFRSYKRNSLLRVSNLVQQIEAHTGSRYRTEDDE